MGFGEDFVTHVTTCKTPASGVVSIICGILDCFLFGIGTIIAAIIDFNAVDIVIGILQLVIPFVGWIWSIVWGIVMIIHGL